jgi:zinc transporter 1/2/3
VTAHAAVTLWHQRQNFKDYYQRKFHGTSGAFGEAKPGPLSIFHYENVAAAAAACDAAYPDVPRSIGAQFQHHFVPRLSRILLRLPPRPAVVDCCAECSECMSKESLVEKNCRDALAIPRGGGVFESIDVTKGGTSAAAVTPYDIPLNMWKIIFQAMLTTINVVCWLVPLKSKKITENKLGLSLANAFSGGVFLSLAFGHLIPECVHGFHGAGKEINDALPYMIVLGGYLLIFFVEKVAFDADEIKKEMESGGGDLNDHSNDLKVTENGSSDPASGFKGRSAVILLGALAVHSILEMTALGLADTFGDSALLSLSIALHQPAESIALLVAFLKSGMPKPQIVRFLSIFSCMGPIGVAIGMAVNDFASPIVDATMLAVVAGTFVYVGATEVIPEEWEDPEHKWKKFLSLIMGIVSIFAITQYTMTLEGF